MRMLDPFFTVFFNNFDNIYLLKAVIWRAIRFILFIKDATLSFIAVIFVKRHYEKLFGNGGLFEY